MVILGIGKQHGTMRLINGTYRFTLSHRGAIALGVVVLIAACILV